MDVNKRKRSIKNVSENVETKAIRTKSKHEVRRPNKIKVTKRIVKKGQTNTNLKIKINFNRNKKNNGKRIVREALSDNDELQEQKEEEIEELPFEEPIVEEPIEDKGVDPQLKQKDNEASFFRTKDLDNLRKEISCVIRKLQKNDKANPNDLTNHFMNLLKQNLLKQALKTFFQQKNLANDITIEKYMVMDLIYHFLLTRNYNGAFNLVYEIKRLELTNEILMKNLLFTLSYASPNRCSEFIDYFLMSPNEKDIAILFTALEKLINIGNHRESHLRGTFWKLSNFILKFDCEFKAKFCKAAIDLAIKSPDRIDSAIEAFKRLPKEELCQMPVSYVKKLIDTAEKYSSIHTLKRFLKERAVFENLIAEKHTENDPGTLQKQLENISSDSQRNCAVKRIESAALTEFVETPNLLMPDQTVNSVEMSSEVPSTAYTIRDPRIVTATLRDIKKVPVTSDCSVRKNSRHKHKRSSSAEQCILVDQDCSAVKNVWQPSDSDKLWDLFAATNIFTEDLMDSVLERLLCANVATGEQFLKFILHLKDKLVLQRNNRITRYVAQLGVSLVLECHKREKFQEAYNILNLLHFCDINYLDLQESGGQSLLVLVSWFDVVLTAVDVCLQVNKPDCALTILEGADWALPCITMECQRRRMVILTQLAYNFVEEYNLTAAKKVFTKLLDSVSEEIAVSL